LGGRYPSGWVGKTFWWKPAEQHVELLVVVGVELGGVKGRPGGFVGGELVGNTLATKGGDESSGTRSVVEVGAEVGGLSVVPTEPKVTVCFLVVGQVGQCPGLRECGPRGVFALYFSAY